MIGDHELLCMCWESNLDPLEENLTMNSTTELFIQVLLCFFSNSFIYQRLCHLKIIGYTLKQQIIFLSGDLPLYESLSWRSVIDYVLTPKGRL